MSFGIELAFILFFGAFTQAMVGFGYGAVFIGLVALMFPLDQVILLSFVYAVPIQFSLVMLTIRYRLGWDAIQLALIGIVGLPIGIYTFSKVNIQFLETLFGLFLIISAVISVFDRVRFSNSRLVLYAVGIFSGFLGALFGSSGPFVSLYLLANRDLKRCHHIFILNIIFLVISCTLVSYYWWHGKYHFVDATLAGYGIFFAVIGTLLGYFTGAIFSYKWYRWIVLSVIFLMGVMFLVK